MVGRHIVDGDVALLEYGREARPGDVVAALIDGESTLKVLVESGFCARRIRSIRI